MSWVRFRDGQAHGFGLLGPGLAQVWREILRWPIGPGFIFWVQIQNINFSFLILSLYINNLSGLESQFMWLQKHTLIKIYTKRISRYLQKQCYWCILSLCRNVLLPFVICLFSYHQVSLSFDKCYAYTPFITHDYL